MLRNDNGVLGDEAAPRGVREERLASEAHWGDVEGDGTVDLIVPVADADVAWIIGTADGVLTGEARRASFRHAAMRRAQDADGDGFPDGAGLISAGSIHSEDFDGDGDDDLLILDAARQTAFVLRRIEDTYEPVTGGAVRLDEPGSLVRWEDTDGDGDQDLVIHEASSGQAKSFPSNGSERTLPGLPDDELRHPMADPPFDHGSDLTGSSLLDDDHPRYLNTESDDTFSDSSWIVQADTGGTDNKRIAIAGGGGAATTDGAYISIAGNDFSPSGGSVGITSGDEDGSFVSLNAEGDTNSFARMTHNADGGTAEEVLQVDANGVSITSVGDNDLYFGEDVYMTFEGATDNGAELFVTVSDPSEDRFISFPNAEGTVAVAGEHPISVSGTGLVTCASCLTAPMQALTPDCYFHPISTDQATYSTSRTTSTGSGTQTGSVGFEFAWDSAGDNNHYELFCSFIVPEDYDDASTLEPFIILKGWSITSIPCSPSCGVTAVVEFEVSSRAYSSGDRADEAWGTERTATMAWFSEACGPDCWQSDRVKSTTVDLAGSASDWQVGDLVYVRIRRDAAATNELPSSVHVPRISVNYPGY